MPRPPRSEFAGAIHHVFARGATGQDVYLDDSDRERYLRLLARASKWMSWRCLAYCLMTNHMHFIVETPSPNLSHGMQRFHGDYAQYFNRRHKRAGHVFQRRFEAVGIEDDAQLWTTVRYVVNNPVAAGLCDTAEAWPWSSHAAILDGTAPQWLAVERLLAYAAAYGGDPLRRYTALVKGSGPL